MTPALQVIPSGHFKKFLFSKWQKIQVLLDPIEMEILLQYLSPLCILNVSQVVPQAKIPVQMDEFMHMYEKYINMLRGKIPRYNVSLSYALSQQIDNFRALVIAPNKSICRMVRPDVQMQTHAFLLDEEGKLLSQVFSMEAIHWGVQLSYPAIFQDGYTMEILQTTNDTFPGWKLFSAIRNWIRNYTVPLPIHFRGKMVRLPIRLGKKATTWIDTHIDRDRVPIDENALLIIRQRQAI